MELELELELELLFLAPTTGYWLQATGCSQMHHLASYHVTSHHIT